jgi:hypothetical protein
MSTNVVLDANKFSYDDKSKNLSIAMIVLAIANIIFMIIALLMKNSRKSIRYSLYITQVLILLAYIISFSLLADHYRNLRSSENYVDKCSYGDTIPYCVYQTKLINVLIGGVISSIALLIFTLVPFILSS